MAPWNGPNNLLRTQPIQRIPAVDFSSVELSRTGVEYAESGLRPIMFTSETEKQQSTAAKTRKSSSTNRVATLTPLDSAASVGLGRAARLTALAR